MRGNVLVMTICECIWPLLSLYVLALGGNYETLGLTMAAARA